jgi:VanZ family protein
MARLVRSPRFWLACFLLWFAVLWLLSSSSLPGEGPPPFPNFDKFAHFGYYFGGSGLLSAYLFRRNPDRPNWKSIIGSVIIAIALTGCLDEYHQTFTPGRSGNDPYDLLADVLGATAGAFTFKRIHLRLK